MKIYKIKIVIYNNHHKLEKVLNSKEEYDKFKLLNFKNKNFAWWTRPIQLYWFALKEFKGTHFIVGYLDNMFKRNEFPSWLYNSKEDEVKINIFHD